MENKLFPPPPEIIKDLFESCVEKSNFMPILFEWYKYTGLVCNYFACIMPESPAINKIWVYPDFPMRL